MAYGDSIQDWITNPAAAWQAVNARVQLAALRFDQRRKQIPDLESKLAAARTRVAQMPAGARRQADQAKVDNAANALAQLKSEANGLVAKVMDAIRTMSDAGARVNAEQFQQLGGLGQIQIIAPLVLVAVIAVAGAALAWSTKFDSKLALFKAGIAAGLSPEEAAKLAAGGGLGGGFAGLNLDLTTVAIGLGLVLLLPTILKQMRGARAA